MYLPVKFLDLEKIAGRERENTHPPPDQKTSFRSNFEKWGVFNSNRRRPCRCGSITDVASFFAKLDTHYETLCCHTNIVFTASSQ